MSCIHFKFKNRQDYEKVPISGLEVSGKELKEAIMKKKKIGHSNLDITDAQTKKVYSDSDMIKRNASVIVMRSVIQNAPKLPKTQHKDPSLLPSTGLETATITSNPNDPQKASDLTSLTGSEEEKLMVMMKQAGEGYTAEDYAKYPTRSGIHPGLFRGPPPRGYVCNRCRKAGHWIQLCPTNGDPNFDRRNRHDLLPKTSTTVGVKSKHIMAPPKEKVLPEELKCPICKQPLRDTVVIPCCNKSFCDECIREHLLENEFTCPLCKEEDVSPDSLVPNKELRESVKQFKSQAAEEKSIAVASLFSHATLTPYQLSASHKAPVTTPTPSLSSQLTSKVAATHPTTTSTTSSSVVTATKPSSASSTLSNSPRVCVNENDESQKSTQEGSQAVHVVESLEEGEAENKKSEEQGAKEEDSVASPTASPAETEKEVEKTGSGANLSVPTAVKRDSHSPSPQCNRSKSPSPLDSRKPTQPIVLTHKKPTHPRSNHPLSNLRPRIPLMTGLHPSILPLPLLHNPVVSNALQGNPSLLNTLPGLGVVPTAHMTPPIVKDYQAEAEFLLSQKRTRGTSPPLTAEEFYRQQKMLHQFIVRKSPAHSVESGLDHSHSSDSESDESDSHSSSDSASESDTSTFSRSRSRSVSPEKKKRRHHASSRKLKNSHHHRKKHAREAVQRERERESVRERGKERHKRKRRRNEASDEVENRRRHSKRHRHGVTKSRDASLDPYPHQSSDAVSSAASETLHHHRHRKTKKRKHRHHRQRRGGEEGVQEEEEGDGGTVGVERGLAGDEALGVDLSGAVEEEGDDIEVGVVDNSAVSSDPSILGGKVPEGSGEVPEVRVSEGTETVDVQHTPDRVVGGEEPLLKGSPVTEVKGDVASGNAGSSVRESPLAVAGREAGSSAGVGRETEGSAEQTGSGDTLLDDIDQLLAEEEGGASEPPRPAGVSPRGDSCVDIDSKPAELEPRESDLPHDNATSETRVAGAAVVAAVTGEEVEGDHLALHTEETIDEEEDTAAVDQDVPATVVDGDLEEGELLSDADEDRVSGQVDDPSCSDGLPRKPRLRSVASTVQVVNSSETLEQTPSDTESPELSPFAPPPPPPLLCSATATPSPEAAREVIQPVKRKHRHHHHHQAHVSEKAPKKRKKLKNKETVSAGHRHHHKRLEREHERVREREGRGRKSRHHRKKHRHHSSS